MRIGLCTIRLLLTVVLAVFAAAAAEPRDAFSGGFEIGYRDAGVNGDEDKYREDVNLRDGAFRLFGLDFSWQPENHKAIDDLTIGAQGIGGEPFQAAWLRARKAGSWDLRATYRSSSFFYRDAGYFFREEGDLHSWDSRRTTYGLDLKVRAAKWLTLRAGANRTERDGRSTTSRDLARDVFELNSPLDQTASTYWLGADLRFGWVNLTLEHRIGSSEDRRSIESGANDGLDPGGARLDNYRQRHVVDADAPVSRVLFGGQPVDWVRFSAAYARASLDSDYRTDSTWSGLDYDDSPIGDPPEPFTASQTNVGTVERTVDVYAGDVSFRPAKRLEITLEGSRRAYDQDATIDSFEEQVGGKDAGTFTVRGALHNEMQLDAYGLTARWDVTRALALSAGVGRQSRSVQFEIGGPDVTTRGWRYRAGLRYRAGQAFDMRVDGEKGTDDDPYTPASPTDVDRVLVSMAIRPGAGVAMALRYKYESRRNDLAYPLGLATDDVPPVTRTEGARFDARSWGATLSWSRGKTVDLAIGFDRMTADSNADIVYVTGSTFFPAFDVFTSRGRTDYAGNQTVVYGRARFGLGASWSLGCSASVARNDGTFPVNWDRYGAEGQYRHRSGVHVRLAFDRYRLDETNPYAGDPASPTPDVNDYGANLWTVALGYRF